MALRFLSSETIDGNLSFNGSTLISSNTADGSDNAQLVISGAGAQGDTRGASVHISGNESGNGGLLQLRAGDGSVGGIRLYTGGAERMRISEPLITFPTITELRGDIASAKFAVGNMGDASSQMMVSSRGFLTFNVSNTGSALNALERLRITATGAISVGPSGTNYGTSGQVLTSQGNALPTWTTPTTGTITGSGTADKVTKFTSATAIGDGPITFATNDSTFAGNIIIHNSSNAPYIDFVESGATTDSKARITMDQIDTDNATLRFSTEGAGTLSERMRIDENGNVAIQPGGATLTNTRLYVVSADNYDPSLYDGMGGIRIGSGGSSSAGDGNYTGGIGFAITSGTSGIAGVQKGADADKQGLAFFTHPSDTGGDAAVEKMRLDADGNLGIGTSSPSSNLHVTGAPANGVYLSYLYNSGTHNSSHGLNVQTAATNIAAYGLRVNTGGDSNALAVMGTGDVGIGTDSPDYKLTINNTGGADTLLKLENTTSNKYPNIRFVALDASYDIGVGGTGTATGYVNNFYIYDVTNSAPRITLTQAGNVGIGTTSPAVKLDVEGSTNAIIKMNSTGGTGGRMDFAHGGTNYGNVGSGKNILGIGNAADMMVNADSVLYLGVGAQTITVKSGGNVGIGTTSPGAQLHNYSTSTQNVWLSGYGTLAQNTWGAGHGIFAAADNGLLISKANAANDTNRLFSFYHDAGGNAEMYMYNTGMTNTVKIDSSGDTFFNGGNVGIGTTTPAADLHVERASATTLALSNSGAVTSGSRGDVAFYNSDVSTVGLIRAGAVTDNVGTKLQFYTRPAGGSLAETFILNSDASAYFAGNLKGPSDILSVYNRLKIANGGIQLNIGQWDGANHRIEGDANRPIVITSYQGNINLGISGGTTINVQSIKVGVGTTNPGSISGGCTTMTFGSTAAALSGGVLFQANGTNVNGTYWESDNMRYQNIGDYSHTFYKNNSTVLFTIATTGTVTATGDVVAYSDERLKSDIKTLDGSKVLKMRGVSFKKEGKKGSGVIAQELEKIAPELVNNDSEYKGVAYGNLSGYLIEAIKEQQKQIDRLEEQIKKMSSKN